MKAAFNGKAAAEFVADMPETLAFCSGHAIHIHPENERRFRPVDSGGASLGRSVMSGQDNIGAFTPVTIHIGHGRMGDTG